MLHTASDPARIGALKVMPEAIPEAFVISMLPPPAPSSRQRASEAPRSAEQRPPRSTPPPLPTAAQSAATPLRTPTLAWDMPALERGNAAAAAEEDARMVRALRGSQRWENGVSWLRRKTEVAWAELTSGVRRLRIWQRVAIVSFVLVATTLVWGLAKKPWAHRRAAPVASAKANLHPQARAHATKMSVSAAARRPDAAPHVKPVDAGKAHAHAAAPAHKQTTHARNAVQPMAKSHAKAPAHSHGNPHHPSKSAHQGSAKKPAKHRGQG